ncbi:unnamed protein product [Absidia cylindrospora]
MTDETAIKRDLLRSKCDNVLGSMRSRAPLTFKGFPSYATFQPPPYDMDEVTGESATFDNRHWAPLPNSSRLDRQALMAKHHFVAEPDWLPPVQTVQHRVPRPRSRGVKLRSVEAIVNDTQRQKALSSEERAGYMTARTPPRQQPPAQRPPPPPPKSKMLDFLNEITSASRTSSSNSSTKSALTPTASTQNGNIKKSQQQPSTPNKKLLDPQHQFKKPVHPSTATPPLSTITSTTPTTTATASTPRSAPRQTGTEKISNKTTDVVSKSRPQSSDTNLDLFITKQFLINDLGDPAATRHLEDLSRSNVVEKRPVLRVRIMLKKKSPNNESKSKEVIKKSKNDTQSSPVVSGDTSTFSLPTGTTPTEFFRSVKIRKKSKADQALATSTPPPSLLHKSSKFHMVELEEGETISPSPSPRRPLSISPDRITSKTSSKRQRDDGGADDNEQQKQQVRRNKTSKKEISVPLSSSSSSSSSSSTSRHATHDNTDDRQYDSGAGSKSGVRKDKYSNNNDDDRKSTSSSSKRLERSISGGGSGSGGGDEYSDSKRKSRRSSSSRRSRDDENSSSSSSRHHRSSQRSSSSRLRRSSRSRSRSRSPRRRSSSSSSNTRSSSLEKSRRHAPLTSATTSSRDPHNKPPPAIKDKLSSTSTASLSSHVNGSGTPKDGGRVKDTLGTPKDLAPTPTTSVPSPAILAMVKESTKNSTASAISAIKNSASKVALDNGKQYPSATAENAETPDQYRIFAMMFQKLALAYKRRGDHADTEIAGLLDHMHAFLNYVMAFHFQDKLGNDNSQKNWDTLHPFTGVLLQKLRSPKNKERQEGALYGLCQRMNALVHFYTFSRRELIAKSKMDRLCDKPSELDDAKHLEYSKSVRKILQDHQMAYQGLRDSDKYMAFEVIQAKFPVSYQNVCVLGQVGPGIVVGGEAGVSVGPMFPLVPYARLHHAAIMAKCILQEFVDKENIDYQTITNTEDYM